MELFNNGKIRVSDTEVNISGFLSNSKYKRDHIKNITYFTGFTKVISIILCIILPWNIIRGIKMMLNVRVDLNLYNGKYATFYVSSDEYNELKNVL